MVTGLAIGLVALVGNGFLTRAGGLAFCGLHLSSIVSFCNACSGRRLRKFRYWTLASCQVRHLHPEGNVRYMKVEKRVAGAISSTSGSKKTHNTTFSPFQTPVRKQNERMRVRG